VPALLDRARRVWARLAGLPVLSQDGLLYLASAALAAGIIAIAVTADYREWAEMAIGPYVAAAAASWVVERRRDRLRGTSGSSPRPRGGVGDPVRATIALLVLVLAVLLPLGYQLVWRADSRPGAHAQPEVAVIERAGDRAAHGLDPYLASPAAVGVSPSSDSRAVDASTFFPYLPGMAVFGMPNVSTGSPELDDARVALTVFTLLIALLALVLVRAPPERRWRAFQFLIVLPSGALPLVTGGDDLPVLALMLLALVLAQRRQPVLSGIAIGLAGTLKFTAWGLLVLLAMAEYDRSGRRAIGRYLWAAAAVVVPVVAAGVAFGPHAFLVNVVEFPLGLTKVNSPAASPLPGQVLVTLLPHLKRALTVVLVALGLAAVLAGWWRWRPSSPAAVSRFTALAIILAILVAPATRFGYFIYPANLLVWSVLVARDGPPAAEAAGLGSSTGVSNLVDGHHELARRGVAAATERRRQRRVHAHDLNRDAPCVAVVPVLLS
jgi:hypothetical protein